MITETTSFDHFFRSIFQDFLGSSYFLPTPTNFPFSWTLRLVLTSPQSFHSPPSPNLGLFFGSFLRIPFPGESTPDLPRPLLQGEAFLMLLHPGQKLPRKPGFSGLRLEQTPYSPGWTSFQSASRCQFVNCIPTTDSGLSLDSPTAGKGTPAAAQRTDPPVPPKPRRQSALRRRGLAHLSLATPGQRYCSWGDEGGRRIIPLLKASLPPLFPPYSPRFITWIASPRSTGQMRGRAAFSSRDSAPSPLRSQPRSSCLR